MSAFKNSDKFYQTPNQPSNANLGDEWFNTTTNRLYQFIGLSGNAPTWIEIPLSTTANTVSVNNLSVAGLTTINSNNNSMGLVVSNITENVAIVTAAPTNYINFFVTAQTVMYITANTTSNMLLNVSGSATALLNTLLAIGQSVSFNIMLTNGPTGYYIPSVRVDSQAPAIVKWLGGLTPTAGNANSIDSYSFTIIKTANATFTVLASMAKFA